MKKISAYTLIIVAMLLAMFVITQSFAQEISMNPRSVGMANTAVGYARGVEAIGINPAAIGLPGLKRASISIFPIAMFAGTDFFDMATYNKYFTGVDDGSGKRTGYYLNASDKAAILATFSDDVGRFATNFGYRIIGGTVSSGIGDFGFNISDRISANLTVPRDYADFLLNGNTPGKTFSFDRTDIKSWWVRDYSASYAHQLYLPLVKYISAGVSVKLVQGFGYFGTESFNSSFTTDPDSFVISGRANMVARYAGTEFLVHMTSTPGAFDLFASPVGSGVGFDVGMYAEINNVLSVGMSITDIGSMTWKRNAKEIVADENIYLNDFSNGDQLDELLNKLNGAEKRIESFETPLPTTLHLGASFKLPRLIGEDDRFMLAGSYRQGFNNEPSTTTTPRIGIGAEWVPVAAFPLRAGVTIGGYTPVALAAGVGLNLGDKFMLDVSTDNLSVLFTQDASAASFAFGMHFEF